MAAEHYIPHSKKSPSSSDLFRFSQAKFTPTHIKVKERTKGLSCFRKDGHITLTGRHVI